MHHCTEGVRLSIGAFRTSPTESILCYTGEIPFQLLRNKNILLYGIKRKTTPDHIGHKPLFKNNINPNPNANKTLISVQDPYSTLYKRKINIHTAIEKKNYFPKNPTMVMELQAQH